MNYKEFLKANVQPGVNRKCPPGFRFDKELGVCVPKGQGRYYGALGFGVAKPNGASGETQNGETENGSLDTSNGKNGGNGIGQ